MVRTYLESRRNEMRKIGLDPATLIRVSTIESVAHNVAIAPVRYCARPALSR
ncbi:hypothetical protein [Bradyrhizobium yuanmingense]|uniref:hypothetical protein n=1 Tax=Bradyrhizobium yuanmingense TaxID=108015 RepID=UPI0023B91EA3|nr:hypothetical protein [Bradyrhizobium yuanmingense]MDF0581765.1 hypothetical protein [Bradyrhizobium yuanmingense]